MKRAIVLAALLSVGLFAGCSGGSNSSAGNGGGTPPPPVTPPPAVDTRFETFLMNILAQTSETSSPFSVNDVGLTFSETPGIFASVTGG